MTYDPAHKTGLFSSWRQEIVPDFIFREMKNEGLINGPKLLILAVKVDWRVLDRGNVIRIIFLLRELLEYC
jgi:hypothetical protein